MFENYAAVIDGMEEVDHLLANCEAIGAKLAKTMSIWSGGDATVGSSAVGLNLVDVNSTYVAAQTSNDPRIREAFRGFLVEQPASMSPKVKLKDYQMLGLNWLNMLFTRGTSCILADEMGAHPPSHNAKQS